jgi:hypothetical protein
METPRKGSRTARSRRHTHHAPLRTQTRSRRRRSLPRPVRRRLRVPSRQPPTAPSLQRPAAPPQRCPFRCSTSRCRIPQWNPPRRPPSTPTAPWTPTLQPKAPVPHRPRPRCRPRRRPSPPMLLRPSAPMRLHSMITARRHPMRLCPQEPTVPRPCRFRSCRRSCSWAPPLALPARQAPLRRPDRAPARRHLRCCQRWLHRPALAIPPPTPMLAAPTQRLLSSPFGASRAAKTTRR